jgi:hypothetical protein
MPQQYVISVSAIGEVRDAQGNLKSSEPVETQIVVDEATLRELLGDNS